MRDIKGTYKLPESPEDLKGPASIVSGGAGQSQLNTQLGPSTIKLLLIYPLISFNKCKIELHIVK